MELFEGWWSDVTMMTALFREFLVSCRRLRCVNTTLIKEIGIAVTELLVKNGSSTRENSFEMDSS